MKYFFDNSIGRTIEWFGIEHILIMFGFVVSMFLIYMFRNYIKQNKHEKVIRYLLIALVFLFEWRVFLDRVLNHSIFRIPLCGIALYLLTYSITFKKQNVFKIAYFYAFGTILTFLFFDTPYALDRFNGWTYFGAHAMIGVLTVYGLFIFDFKPFKRDLFNAMGFLALYALISGYATFRFGGSDELFLKNPPVDFLSGIQSFSQVLYTATIVLIAAVMMLLMYLPLHKKTKRK